VRVRSVCVGCPNSPGWLLITLLPYNHHPYNLAPQKDRGTEGEGGMKVKGKGRGNEWWCLTQNPLTTPFTPHAPSTHPDPQTVCMYVLRARALPMSSVSVIPIKVMNVVITHAYALTQALEGGEPNN